MNIKNNDLLMQFDPNTIEHLGIQMYSTLPPVISELVANSYDADATIVNIYFDDSDTKKIIFEDNGHGMLFDDLNNKFLRIGRNRREDDGTQLSLSGKRKVIGKKGIGKLSFFGISNTILVTTTRDSVKNSFQMSWDHIKKAGKDKHDYHPEIITVNEKVEEPNGTRIELLHLNRTSNFKIDRLAVSVAKYFTIFDEHDFTVRLIHNSDEDNAVTINNEMKFENIDEEYTWNFPLDKPIVDYEYNEEITGKIISAKTVVQNTINGIALFSRGKLVNEHSFYDINTSSNGFAYITGWLNVDFIDEWGQEVISTNRRSLNWVDSDAEKLGNYLARIIMEFFNKAKEKRAELKVSQVEASTGVKIYKWIESLPKPDKKLAKKIVSSIVNSAGISTTKAGELINYFQDSFRLEAFQEIASDLDDDFFEENGKVLEFFKTWKIIESREMYKLSKVRIETIKAFEQHIQNDSREVPELHNFLKQFSWILDPRIMNFRDEITFSKLLREKYDDITEPEQERRIDFLCVDFSNNVFIIELKRPSKIIGKKDLDQGMEYVEFIKQHFGNSLSRNIVCYLIGKKLSPNPVAISYAESLEKTNKVYVKTFHELLGTARAYHQEFIENYEQSEEEVVSNDE